MISDALRLIRVFHDLRQQELADHLKISKSHISEIESGKKTPSLEVIGKYADFFSIPPSSIMFFAENMDEPGNRSTDDKVKAAIAGKVVQFLKFIEAKTDENTQGLRPQR